MFYICFRIIRFIRIFYFWILGQMEFDLRAYIFRKFYAPRKMIIDKPGVIIHKSNGVFESGRIFSRSIFSFEETYSKLFLDTVKHLGYKEAGELWYRIGKDAVLKYFRIYSKIKKTPKNREKMIRYFATHFSAVGMTVMSNVYMDFKKGVFMFTGKNSVPCRGYSSGMYVSGVVSGLLSFILDKNIEAKPLCRGCPEGCCVVASFSFDEKYIPDVEGCEIFNYSTHIPARESFSSGLTTFSDLLKFGRVKIDSNKKFHFMGKTLIPMEGSLPSIILRNYKSAGLLDIFRESILKSSRKLVEDLVRHCDSEEQKIRFLRNLFSSLGWGEIYFSKNSNRISVSFLHQFYKKGKPELLYAILHSAVEIIFVKKAVLKSESDKRLDFVFS